VGLTSKQIHEVAIFPVQVGFPLSRE
jgi:hypothetical protein